MTLVCRTDNRLRRGGSCVAEGGSSAQSLGREGNSEEDVRLIFTKRGGKQDDLVIERDGVALDPIACPKQGILPHDMVHFAVESTLAHGGFLSLVADGQPAAFETMGGDAEEAIERLVETFQAEMWGGRVPAAELLATYAHACEARGHAVAPVSAQDVDAIRARLNALTVQWAEVPVNGNLVLDF